jgi:uncharacterized membrane protein
MIEISNWIHSPIGGIHVISSVIGLITGAFILLTKKATKIHRKTGYVFVVSLLLVNISALFIYDFNDGQISVFHYLIPVSLVFLLYGMYPMLIKSEKKNRLNKHIIGMNGAALGLWAAGATEYFVRELAFGLDKTQLILYSFLISVPFAILITVSITYNLIKIKPKGGFSADNTATTE